MAMSAREASRAERFEDEKRRIIDSCFGKRDEDGSSEQHPSAVSPIRSLPCLGTYVR
jgi:hypothetical protein